MSKSLISSCYFFAWSVSSNSSFLTHSSLPILTAGIFCRSMSLETDDYPGIRVYLKAMYPPMAVPLTIDVTTGDSITPGPVAYDDHASVGNHKRSVSFSYRSVHYCVWSCSSN